MKYLLAVCLLLAFSSCMKTPPAGPINTEKDYYKLMYEQAVVSQANATTLTQWTLASVGALIAVVLGTQAFFNYSLNTRKLDAIDANMKGQIATSQSVVLTRLSELNAANLATTESRAQALENQLRLTINRELDAKKDFFQKLYEDKIKTMESDIARISKMAATDHALVVGQNYLDEKKYEAALEAFLPYAEARITPGMASLTPSYLLADNFLKNIVELDKTIYDRILKLKQILADDGQIGPESVLKYNLSKIKVYYNEAMVGKRYIENPSL